MNLVETFLALLIRGILQASLERVDDLASRQAAATRAANRQDKRPSKPLFVSRIELGEGFKFVRAATIKPDGLLLAFRVVGKTRVNLGLACQLGMGANQCQLRIKRGSGHNVPTDLTKMGKRLKGPGSQCLFDDPVRMLVKTCEQSQSSFMPTCLIKKIKAQTRCPRC